MKNIVWLASYPKSGNTWFRMFLANYMKNGLNPATLEEIESSSIASNAIDFEEIIALNPFELTADEVDLYRPDVYRALSEEAEKNGETIYKKVHDAYSLNNKNEPLFPIEVSKFAIYFVRNPLDVCVSYSNHRVKEIQNTIALLLNEEASLAGKKSGQLRQILMSWESHVQSWSNQTLIPVHFIRYEDMIQMPIETFGSIVNFLELGFEKERLEKAILNSDFKILQQMEHDNGFRERLQNCKQFFWKGKIGNYRDYLSEEQINRIVDYNYDTMRQFGYIDEQGKLTV